MSSEIVPRTARPKPVPLPRNSDEFRCLYCSGSSFRRSRLRPSDFFVLLGLRYPVRCLRCSRRQMVSFSLAGLSVPSNIQHHRVRTEAESWRTWTNGEHGKSQDPNAPSPAAPASTVAMNRGPRLRTGHSPAEPRP